MNAQKTVIAIVKNTYELRQLPANATSAQLHGRSEDMRTFDRNINTNGTVGGFIETTPGNAAQNPDNFIIEQHALVLQGAVVKQNVSCCEILSGTARKSPSEIEVDSVHPKAALRK